MQLQNQDVFLIENLQPSWLQPNRWRIMFSVLSSLLGIVPLLGLFFGLLGGLLGEPDGGGVTDKLTLGLVGLIFGLVVGIVAAMIGIIIDILRFRWLDKWQAQKEVSNFLWSVINVASLVLLTGLLGGLIGGLLGNLSGKPIFGLGIGLIVGLSSGLMGGLVNEIFELPLRIRSNRKNPMDGIFTVEALRWNWGRALKGVLVFGLVGGLFAWLLGWLLSGQFVGLFFGLGLLGGLLLGVMLSVLIGTNREILETKTIPNQGIHLTARNAIYVGLFLGLVPGLIATLVSGLLDGLLVGLLIGLPGILASGGGYIIAHYSLRLILIIQGRTPRNYARFLDYAVERIFLQKVGGGYRFIHRLLLEHFAEMYEKKS